MPGITNQESIGKYRVNAAVYDARSRRTWKLRERTIARLHLRYGDVVVDTGCGTGLSFELLATGVGQTGRVIGIEQSPEMFALARERVARVAIAGMKYFPSWTGPLNVYAFFKNRAYNGIAGDLWTPWDIVAQYVPDLQISSTQFGMGYIAHGTAQRPFAAPSVRRLGKSRGEYEWLPEVFRCTRN